MPELGLRSARLAEFAAHWTGVGGPEAKLQDLLLPDYHPRLAVLCKRGGEWLYFFNGAMHYAINKVPLTGRCADRIPPHIWARTATLHARGVQTSVAQYIETTGYVGRSVDLLFRQLRVTCTPPEGCEAMVVSCCEWDAQLEPMQEELLADLVGRSAGPALRQVFLADRPGIARVAAQLALLRELLGGAYGSLSAADQAYLQIFLLGLDAEYETDGHSLERLN